MLEWIRYLNSCLVVCGEVVIQTCYNMLKVRFVCTCVLFSILTVSYLWLDNFLSAMLAYFASGDKVLVSAELCTSKDVGQ